MSCVIRPIDPRHADDWQRLRTRLWAGEDHGPEVRRFFAGTLDEPVEVLLAFDDRGCAVAHVELSIRDDVAGLTGVRTGYVEGLYVDPAHRGTGLASQLLRAAVRWAAANGCRAFASDREDRVIVHARFTGRDVRARAVGRDRPEAMPGTRPRRASSDDVHASLGPAGVASYLAGVATRRRNGARPPIAPHALAPVPPSLAYPIGPFEPPGRHAPADRGRHLDVLADLPRALRDAVAGLGEAQLDAPYRPGGWTVRQVVHHVADSHLNGYLRVKLALTAEAPVIVPYDERAWAELPDAALPIAPSLAIVDGVHARLDALLRALPEAAFARHFVHPELGVEVLDTWVARYAWHGRHHVAHVTALRAREGW